MRGNWVGTPRANPTADTHVEPAQRSGPLFVRKWAEHNKALRIGIADRWDPGQV